VKPIRSCSLRRYRIDGPLPDPRRPEILARLCARRFRPLAPHEERAFGWVSPGNLLVSEIEPEALAAGSRFMLSFRIDRRRVSPRLLKAHLDLEIRARVKAARDGAGAPRLDREERRKIRTELQQELLRQASPQAEAHTVVIDPPSGEVWVLTLSRAADEVFRALFQDTFEVDPIPIVPWLPARAAPTSRTSPRAAVPLAPREAE
jgi:DNA recombination-dependent growth factor C